MRPLVLLFISIPIIEIFLLLKVGSLIGAVPTIALVLFTATFGLWLLRREGINTLHQVQAKLARSEIPGQELLEGIMLLIGGALLLTPGFVTDAIGFSCIVPLFRKPIAAWLIHKGLMSKLQINPGGFSTSAGFQETQAREHTNNTIEGEFNDVTSNKDLDKP